MIATPTTPTTLRVGQMMMMTLQAVVIAIRRRSMKLGDEGLFSMRMFFLGYILMGLNRAYPHLLCSCSIVVYCVFEDIVWLKYSITRGDIRFCGITQPKSLKKRLTTYMRLFINY